MNILMTHGYLLSGTGSNIYVQNLARTFVSLGHTVVLLCQDREAGELDFVERFGRFGADNQDFGLLDETPTPYPGHCTCLVPDIAGLLPVYALDPYPGFKVKTFPQCSDEEIETYIECNRVAIEFLLRRFAIDVIQTHHAIMFPYIVSQVAEDLRPPHFIKVHGSALNISVKCQRRLVPYALAGLESAENILVNSDHAYRELVDFLMDEDRECLTDRMRIVPAGVNVEQFPFFTSKQHAVEGCLKFAKGIMPQTGGRSKETTQACWQRWRDGDAPTAEVIRQLKESYDYRRPDEDLPEVLQAIAWGDDPVIYFIGKYLWTKGIQLMLLAAPLILEQRPRAQFLFTGFGPFRETAEWIIQQLAAGRPEELLADRTYLVDDEGAPLPYFKENLRALMPTLQRVLPKTKGLMETNTHFTGIMNHEEIKHVLPAVDLLMAPSVFPESFGMVAVEAMACGVAPLLTYQSSFRELSEAFIKQGKTFGLQLEAVRLDESASRLIAENVLTLVEFGAAPEHTERRAQLRRALRDTVEEKYSWQAVASHYLRHWQGAS